MFSVLIFLMCMTSVAGRGHLRTGVDSKPKQIVGIMKGLVDGYVQKYDDELSRFQEAEKGMKEVIASMEKDPEAKARAVDENVRLKGEHEDKLRDITRFVRTLDDAVNAMTVSDKSWMEDFPTLKGKVDNMYDKFPAALISRTSQISQHSRGSVTAMTSERAASLVAQASIFLKYLT